MKESILTNGIRNAFDENDVRVREYPYALDAQLFNSVANVMEDFHHRASLAIESRIPVLCPLNIDNRGVWYSFYVPRTLELSTGDDGVLQPPIMVASGADLPGGSATLVEYDEDLPVPRRLSLATDRTAVDYTGADVVVTPTSELESASGFTPTIPNRLYIEVTSTQDIFRSGELVIQGKATTRSLLRHERFRPQQEIVPINDAGFYQTINAWSEIDSIVIKDLKDVTISVFSVPFGLSRRSDERPYTAPGYRNIVFPRSWKLEDARAFEQFTINRLAGYESVHVHSLPASAVDILPEPNTNGMLICRGDELTFTDRRSRYPELLDRTGITSEPLFGLRADLVYRNGAFAINLRSTPFTQADTIWMHRYVVETETDSYVLINGVSGFLASASGWVTGKPGNLSFVPWFTGSAVILLETLTFERQLSWDAAAVRLQSLDPVASLALPAGVPELTNLCYDYRQRLWGLGVDSKAYPLDIHYDAYQFDPALRLVYLTDLYDSVDVTI